MFQFNTIYIHHKIQPFHCIVQEAAQCRFPPSVMSSTMTEIIFTQWQRTQKIISYLRPKTQGQLSDYQWFRIIGYRDHLTTLTSFHETHCLLVHFVPLYLGSKSRLHHRLSWKSLMCQPKYRFLLSFWNDKTAVSYNPVSL